MTRRLRTDRMRERPRKRLPVAALVCLATAVLVALAIHLLHH